MERKKMIVIGGLGGVLFLLLLVDALTVEWQATKALFAGSASSPQIIVLNPPDTPSSQGEATSSSEALPPSSPSSASSETAEPAPPAESSSAPSEVTPTPEPPSGAVGKVREPNIEEVAQRLQMTLQDTSTPSLLSRVLPANEKAEQKVLLINGDRAGFVAWVTSAAVKQDFMVLKDALHSSFSPQMSDLIDEIQHPEGKPTRNYLTFKDPALSEERLVFVRVRSRLYEFHLTTGKDAAMSAFIDALSE